MVLKITQETNVIYFKKIIKKREMHSGGPKRNFDTNKDLVAQYQLKPMSRNPQRENKK